VSSQKIVYSTTLLKVCALVGFYALPGIGQDDTLPAPIPSLVELNSPVQAAQTTDSESTPLNASGSANDSPPADGLNSASSSKAANSSKAAKPDQDATYKEILQIARDGVRRIDEEIQDYRCLLVKRERVDGALGDYQYMLAKVRHERDSSDSVPFSLYLRFLKPNDLHDREVLFVTGANDGKIIAKKGGDRFSYLTTEVSPDSEIAMKGNRYRITEFGVQNLAHKLLDIAEDENLVEAYDVELRRRSKVDGRSCLAILVKKRERTDSDRFYKAHVFIDKELMVPVHYEAYDWPNDGKAPRLLEQYTYRQLKLNEGLSSTDFDRNNPKYGFRKKK
jgi:hypothetical protein